MFDKSFMLKTANEVIKDVIIPHLANDMAKEQAIALLSVLKNIDTHTVENQQPKEQLNQLITQTIHELLQKIRMAHFTFHWVEELETALEETASIVDVTVKWKQLNEIQCQLLRFLYKESTVNPEMEEQCIFPLRKMLREQLKFEMALVR
ncbi:hypothetical protein [Neobacillus sp. Marseille-QA0830]